MRKINRNIILLSIILASVFVNNSSIYAATPVKKGLANKNHELIETNKAAFENALKNNDYALFISTLKGMGISENISTDQFAVLVNAYNLFKANKKDEAVKLLAANNVNPILIKFINNKPELTTAQKDTLKQAAELIKQGKIEEAKAIIKAAGLPDMPVSINKKIDKVETKAKKEEIKKAFDEARELRKQGKLDEAKKVLKDAGIPDQIQEKIRPEFDKGNKSEKVGFFQSLKNLFIK